ncbi:MAG: hypothetical protein ACI4UO_03185, partial [Paludibacteraceae bacterium]
MFVTSLRVQPRRGFFTPDLSGFVHLLSSQPEGLPYTQFQNLFSTSTLSPSGTIFIRMSLGISTGSPS